MADRDAGSSQVQLDIIKYHVNFEPKNPLRDDQEWRNMPEIPTPIELNPDWNDQEQVAKIKSRLLHNTVERPWGNKDIYLETHYRLQREESITMLRYSIRKFRQDPFMRDDDETCVYTKVFVQGYLMTRFGPICRVRFSAERAGKRIRWNQTRRLTTGSLVVLTTAKDCFRSICMPAVIADHVVRNGLDQNPPTIQFYWANVEDAIMDPNTELVMVESRYGYFESTRHTMVGLQHTAAIETPLDKYLVQADKRDLPAKFVVEAPWMNLASLVHHIPHVATMSKRDAAEKVHNMKESLRRYPILDGIDDKLAQYTNLDNSQLEAVHRILTKELSIIQGPPGTGKTFTSVQALRILLESRNRGKSIIVVAAQTNHAVDQILMQLTKLNYNIVRLGGRTQNEDMKYYSMYNVRRRAVPRTVQKSDRDFKNFESARKKNITALQDIIRQVFPDDVLDPGELLSAGIITQQQFDSLDSDGEWVSAVQPDVPNAIMAQWLGPIQLVKVSPMNYKDPIFGAEEDIGERGTRAEMVDTDGYDIELDDCVADDDADRGTIRGTFVPISHVWTGLNTRGYSDDDFRVRKEMKRTNLWAIDTKIRGAVYQAWQRRLLELHVTEFRKVLADNKRITNNLKINRWYKDIQVIKSTGLQVIGCTTTGLTKYRGLLAALQPQTMLIEEAAETREANIISALYPSLEQLILVGDHQQLVPHCDTPALADPPFNLCVSLFERLVGLQLPFTMLNMQRRMIPSLRRVLNAFYPTLQDHPVVTKPNARPSIPGMAKESFLFPHTWGEGIDEDMSRFNVLEAEMVVGFIQYLRLNGVHDSQMSVLTFYRGQRKKILAEAKRNAFSSRPFTNVHTVDSYQGEENDIIILSLVRSNGGNGMAQAGFLADKNRGVVSISRARRGFYIFGNIQNLLDASVESHAMWGKVYQVFQEQNRVGEDGRLPITCKTHGRTTIISHPDGWCNNHGGCDLPCQEILGCGHPCKLQCHPMPHKYLICQEPCTRQLSCGHRCQKVCGKECYCDCYAFTGAYPDDESNKDTILNNSDKDSHVVTEYGRAKATLSSRRGVRGGYPNARGGYQSRSGESDDNHGSMYRTFNNILGFNSSAPDDALSRGPSNRDNYDARQDDAKALQEARQGAVQSYPLIDLSDEPGSNLEKRDGPIVRDTFRPVTLTSSGMRTVGESIVSNSRSYSLDKFEFAQNTASTYIQRNTTHPSQVASPLPSGNELDKVSQDLIDISITENDGLDSIRGNQLGGKDGVWTSE